MSSGIRQIKRGRGHSYTIDGEPVLGVTTALDVLGKPALINWAANTTAGYAVDNWADLSKMPPSKRLAVLQKARFAEVDKASNRGTEVHRLAQGLLHGRKVEVPEELAGHVESCVKFLDDWEPKPIVTEFVVADRKWKYCGQGDAVLQLRNGEVVIIDWKTGRTGIYPEAALQLAAYRFAEVRLGDDGEEHPMSELGIGDTGWGVHIRADGYDRIPLDVSEAVFRYFTHVLHVARMQRDVMDSWRGGALYPPRHVS
jgi:hypothetical protein